MARFGVDVLLKYTNKPDWVKQMRNIEKINRRKERQINNEATAVDSDDGMGSAFLLHSSDNRCFLLQKVVVKPFLA